MTQPSPAIDSLIALTDEDLVSLLSKDPGFFKRAQKAMLEAKRLEAERKRADELATLGAGIDPKVYAKAAAMIQGPYNEANNAELRSLLTGSNISAAPDGSPSLLTLSLDYLSTKQRVELHWPAILVSLGATAGETEMRSLKSLYEHRSYGLGGFSNQLPGMILSRPGPWSEIETKIGLPLAAFLEKISGQGNLWGAKTWKAMKNLAESGCPCPAPASALNPEFWQGLSERPLPAAAPLKPAARVKAAEARRECFAAMLAAGWITRGSIRLSDSLRPNFASQPGSNLSCDPSMALLHSGAIDETALDIFSLLCESEIGSGSFHRYDDVGRSRLFFLNERFRSMGDQNGAASAILLALAQACLERGDIPESVNPQNPITRSANKQMAGMLGSWIERAELGGAAASAPAAAPTRSGARL